MPSDSTIQIVAIIATVSTLLGWTVRFMFKYFTRRMDSLIEQGQTNTENFVNTINHNQTKINKSIDELTRTMKDQTEVFKQLIKDDYGRKN